jgi:NADPH-dependent 2,4-dienoyl-CoA reductase/sulfur reductase-like enzyme
VSESGVLDVDVVVVGGVPTGAAMAAELGMRGVSAVGTGSAAADEVACCA